MVCSTAAIAGGVVTGIVLVLIVVVVVTTALVVCKAQQNKYETYIVLQVFEWEITCVKII